MDPESALRLKPPAAGWPVLLFFGLLLLLMTAFAGLNALVGLFRFSLPAALMVAMWIPGVAGLIAARTAGIAVFGLSRSRLRFLVLAIIAPVSVCAIVYGALWFSGLALLQNDLHAVGPGWRFGLGFLFSIVGAFGEETGWRGFLTTCLARRLGFAGLIWCSWLPWFLFYLWLFFLVGAYATTGYGLQIATIGTLLFGLNVSLVWLRLKTGSLMPAVLFHAMHNFLAFNPLMLGSSHQPWLAGKLGLALACGYLAISIGSLWDGSRERLAPTRE